ncbi:ABC transporter ATP-binding protein [Cesiribacter andamanensis]|uniref:Putative ABC transporter ATP-binding protein YbhF n=1 Tax=Cesiribacter andamanensis AMV16 TaxID=1279009 RepID=M7N5V2_9BACT|nr:ABC transporter ATP-binding protein [Cesiribacter andamanensis]EMR04013.1 putative ABC transporter ATP-binding protein YbhF [Cesiribacter andamanensis AMV16]
MRLSIKNISKEYAGGKLALRNISLEQQNGILGLLGPNGAGKSSLMRILATITQPTAGSVHWEGIDILKNPNALRRVLGYLPQDFGVYPNLSPQEFLTYLAAIKGMSGRATRQRIEALLEEVNLTEVRHQPIRTFSGGMRQRIGIAQVLLNDPRLIIMDEPTVGLDPEERVRFRNLLSQLSGERLVILSSHIVSDIETIASSIAIINGGSLLQHNYPHEILQGVEGKVYEALLEEAELKDFASRQQIIHTMRRQGGWMARYLNASGLPAHSTETPVRATLEDAYLWQVSHKAKASAYV